MTISNYGSAYPFIKLIDLPYRVNIPNSTATLHTR